MVSSQVTIRDSFIAIGWTHVPAAIEACSGPRVALTVWLFTQKKILL